MTLPRRHKTHIIETKSRDILRSAFPSSWVARDISERDYGVDIYLEIVGSDQLLSGDMVALQAKGAIKIEFDSKGSATIANVKRSTINYLLALPVPTFLFAVCCDTGRCFWVNLKEKDRQDGFPGEANKFSVALKESHDLSERGIALFLRSQEMERRWLEIENAIEKSVMLFNTLGPLVLMAQRGYDEVSCTTTYQYLLNQHYEHYVILSKFLLKRNPIPLGHWYEKNSDIPYGTPEGPGTLRFSVLKELYKGILSDYRDCLLKAYRLVTASQKAYFSRKKPWLVNHLEARPHTFVMDDWYARYFFDEYGNETSHPERLYFEDVDAFDSLLDDMIPG